MTAAEEAESAAQGELEAQRLGLAKPGRPSVWQDLKLRRGRVEIEHTNGEIIRLGETHGIATPANRVLLDTCVRMASERAAPGDVSVGELRERVERATRG